MTYSLDQIAISSLASFVVSGLLTNMFKEWLDRARPDITITSFGLDGNSEPIEISSKLIELSKQSGWIKTLRKYEKYKKLRNTANEMRRLQARLKIAEHLSDSWVSEHKNWATQDSGQCDFEELSSVPIFLNQVIQSTLYGSVKRKEVSLPPVIYGDLMNLENITEIKQDIKGWSIYMRSKGLIVPTIDSPSQSVKDELTLVAQSLAKGCKKNIFHYISETRRLIIESTGKIYDLLEELDNIILPKSLPTIKITIYNPGAKPIAFHSFAKIRFHNKELRELNTTLRFVDRKEGGNDEDNGDEVSVTDPLPSVDSIIRVFVGAKSQGDAYLTAVEPLGATAVRVLSLYQAAVLEYSIELLTVSGKMIKSRNATFGPSLTEDEIRAFKVKNK